MHNRLESDATQARSGLSHTDLLKESSPPQQRRAAQVWRRLGGWVRANTFVPSWLPGRLRHPALGYVAAVFLEGLAATFTVLLRISVMGFGLFTLLMLSTVVVVALIWSSGPSLLASLVGILLLWFFVIPPQFSWSITSVGEITSLGLFLAMGVLISLIAGQVVKARGQAEQARQAAEAQAAQLHTIFETLVDGLFVFDRDGHLLQQNHAAQALLGLDPASQSASGPVVERVMRLTPRDTEGQPLTLDQTASRRVLQGEVLSGETALDVWVRTLNGQEVFLSMTGAPIRTQQGEIRGGVVLARDLTERHRLEEGLAARTRELEAVLESMTDGVIVFDAVGHPLRTNRASLALQQRYMPSDDPSRSVIDRAIETLVYDLAGHLLSPEQIPSARVLRGETLSGAESVDVVSRTLGGEELSFNVSGTPLYTAEGSQVGGVIVSRDITQRRRLEQRTQKALAALIELAHALVAVPKRAAIQPGVLAQRLADFTTEALGAERVLLVSCDAETGMLHPLGAAGLTPEQERCWCTSVEGMPWGAWWGPMVAARLEAGEVVQIAEADAALVQVPNLFGNQRRLLAPLRAEQHLIGVLAVGRPGSKLSFTPQEEALLGAVAELCTLVLERERLLYEREEARAQVVALEQTKGQMEIFLALAGQELKLPLTALRLGFEIVKWHALRQSPHDPEIIEWLSYPGPQLLEHLARWEQQFRRMEQVVGELLEVSSIQAGQLALHLELADVVTIVRQAVEEQQGAYPHRSMHLRLPATERLLLRADAQRLGQVVTHYLTNALTYSPADQPVEVGLERCGQHVRVWVRDQGLGIPEASQARIWERFAHVPGVASPSGAGVGLGLGLYLCRSIIERHGGQVGIQSAPGAGSTFWFTLPLQPPYEPAQEKAG